MMELNALLVRKGNFCAQFVDTVRGIHAHCYSGEYAAFQKIIFPGRAFFRPVINSKACNADRSEAFVGTSDYENCYFKLGNVIRVLVGTSGFHTLI